jgi:uncharacterized protein Smg (DUF494 family)
MTDGRSGNPSGGLQRGPSMAGGAYGDARSGGQQFSPDQMRQFQREFAERATDLQGLRRELQQAGVQTDDLEDVVALLQRLAADNARGNPQGMQELTAEALQTLKKFEFELRKKLDQSNNAIYLNGNEEIPASFRSMVEEYYRSLAKKGGR